jgi:Na+/H+ antiporter NhaD/arsenite permease-like protein
LFSLFGVVVMVLLRREGVDISFTSFFSISYGSGFFTTVKQRRQGKNKK